MCCSPLILLLITGALLIPTEGQDDYRKLSGIYKDIADMAIKYVNKIPKQPEQHMNFFRFQRRTQGSNLLSTELLLRATNCQNTGKTTQQNGCKFMKEVRLINCWVCTDDLTRLERSFIHCDWQKNAAKHAEHRKKGCKKYEAGQSTVLAQKTDMDPAPECLGCL